MKTHILTCSLLLAATPWAALAQTDFTKTTINAGNLFAGVAWMDYDGDGFLDLVLANGISSPGGDNNALFHNNGDGSFTQITSGPVANDLGYSLSVAWGDYDNDGLPDLFFGGDGGPTPTVPSLFYRNTGPDFQRITNGPLANSMGNFVAVWGDYDRDGFLDIFLANTPGTNLLFHNNGDGSFSPVDFPTFGVGPNGTSYNGATWADFDNDGYPDLFIYNGGGHNWLFHNNRDGKFSQVHGAPFDTDPAQSVGAAWGDYDNDGFLDLFVATGSYDSFPHHNFLYHNNGNGTFTKITTGNIVTDSGSAGAAAWEDYDNDGNLDLLVSYNTGTGSPGRRNALYHNNGDGSFTSVTNSVLVAESGNSVGVAWGDIDNDGFPDLFLVGNGQPSGLYHNQGNTNSWIGFKLVGSLSNRSAIGAKVRAKATIRGKAYWQMREVSNGDGISGNSLNPHFGLGDATNVDTVRIEWPSGAVQEFHNVAAKQYLTVTEPSQLVASSSDGRQFALKGGRNLQYDIETTTNLADWSLLKTLLITNLNGTALITDTNASSTVRRFYRARLH